MDEDRLAELEQMVKDASDSVMETEKRFAEVCSVVWTSQKAFTETVTSDFGSPLLYRFPLCYYCENDQWLYVSYFRNKCCNIAATRI